MSDRERTDERVPRCRVCDLNQASHRLPNGLAVCRDCWEGWLEGLFDQDDPLEIDRRSTP